WSSVVRSSALIAGQTATPNSETSDTRGAAAAAPVPAHAVGTDDPAATLQRPPRIAPAPARHYRHSSLWRLRPYIRPFVSRFVFSFLMALGGIGLTLAIPLLTQAVIDGPVAHSDQRGLWILGIAAVALGITEAVVQWGRRWVINVGTVGVET